MLLRTAPWIALPALILAAVATLSPFSSPSATQALANCDTSTADLDDAELEMLALINEARAAEGLNAVTPSPALNRAAAWKSEDASAGPPNFSHRDSLGRTTVDPPPNNRAIDCGYPDVAGENIAYGYRSARATFEAWMNSPGHRANILSHWYVVVGIGRSGDRWTTTFGFVDDVGGSNPELPAATSTPTAAPSASPTPTPAEEPAPQSAPVATIFSIDLAAGFNLVTYGGPTGPVADALASLAGLQVWVYAWDAGAGAWLRYVLDGPAYLNTIDQLERGRAYIVWVSAPATWQR
ncbi:MAG: hypothetical protein Kow0010_13380 [Dehalococcoidia bacterium]